MYSGSGTDIVHRLKLAEQCTRRALPRADTLRRGARLLQRRALPNLRCIRCHGCGGPLADASAPDVCSRRFSGTSFLRKIRSLLGFLIEAQKKVAKVVAGVTGGVKSYKTLLLFVDIYMISL